MLSSFQKHVTDHLAFLKESKLLIAISGGLDSTVLVHLCHQSHLKFSLAHCNFNLRGSESDGDEQFVIDLANELDVEVFVESFDTEIYAESNSLSIQMAARELRYNWFMQLCKDLNFDYILTAHHADDNFETLLINLSRGTGLEGLTGIPEQNGNIIRPLLPFSREELENYANENDWNWREDSSNSSSKYLRNALRNKVIPQLKQIKSHILTNSIETIRHLNDAQYLISEYMEQVSKAVIDHQDGDEIHFNCAELLEKKNPKAYLYELLKDYGFTEWNDVKDLLTAQSGKFVSSSTHQLLKNRDHLILSTITAGGFEEYQIDLLDGKFELPDFNLNFKEVDQRDESTPTIIYVDADSIQFPLKLRKWQEGDYFFPFGMKGKKKLSKFFKDLKLSKYEKDEVWLLISLDDIVWVVGHRSDERFKVKDSTEQILKIELNPKDD